MRTPDKMEREGGGGSMCIQMEGGGKGTGKLTEREGNKEGKYTRQIFFYPPAALVRVLRI